MKKIKEYIVNFFNGFMMALADSVPGVSGGTIAFLLGFYDKFITSLNYLMSKNKNLKINLQNNTYQNTDLKYNLFFYSLL